MAEIPLKRHKSSIQPTNHTSVTLSLPLGLFGVKIQEFEMFAFIGLCCNRGMHTSQIHLSFLTTLVNGSLVLDNIKQKISYEKVFNDHYNERTFCRFRLYLFLGVSTNSCWYCSSCLVDCIYILSFSSTPSLWLSDQWDILLNILKRQQNDTLIRIHPSKTQALIHSGGYLYRKYT